MNMLLVICMWYLVWLDGSVLGSGVMLLVLM